MSLPRRFDLLIVDEVHTCAPAGRGRYAPRLAADRGDPNDRTRISSTGCSCRPPRTTVTPSHSRHCWSCLIRSDSPVESCHARLPDAGAGAAAQVRAARGTRPATRMEHRAFRDVLIIPIEVRLPCRANATPTSGWPAMPSCSSKHARSSTTRTASEFVTLLLKKRLFSSPAAFGAYTLDVHMRTVAREAAAAAATAGAERGPATTRSLASTRTSNSNPR